MRRFASRATLALLLALSGCCGPWMCLTAPILDGFPPGSRAAVVLFHVAWGVESYQAPPSFPQRPGPQSPGFAPPPPVGPAGIDHPAAVYEAFRQGLTEAGRARLISDERVRSLPDLQALLPSLSAPSYSSPAPAPDARAFPFPLEVGDAPLVEQRWGDSTPLPRQIAKPTDLYTYHLAPVSSRMSVLARQLGADGLVELFLRPVVVVNPGGPGGYTVEPLRIFAMVTVFGPDGRRRYENIFRSAAIRVGDPALFALQSTGPSQVGIVDPHFLQQVTVQFAHELGKRVAAEAFSG